MCMAFFVRMKNIFMFITVLEIFANRFIKYLSKDVYLQFLPFIVPQKVMMPFEWRGLKYSPL
jgi:hypothetical protein